MMNTDPKQIRLLDLIRLAEVKLEEFKIHYATPTGVPTPLDEFFAGRFEEWQKIQSRKNFSKPHVLSLIQLKADHWLFAGVFRVLGVSPIVFKGKDFFEYQTEEIGGLEHLVGRAMVFFKKDFRQPYPLGKNFGEALTVYAIREQRMTIEDFPGFNKALVSYAKLQTIIQESNPSWKGALSNVSGVYLIVDTTDGRQYVGSAYGKDGIWQRWSEYAKNGHGNNADLKKLLKEKGSEHAAKLKWSLLEICDSAASMEYVIERECHWKEVLLSREFGLNLN